MYNIFLIGDALVGKDTYLQRHNSGKFTQEYVRSTEVENYLLKFALDHELFTVNCYSVPGNYSDGKTSDLLSKAHGIVLMFDVTNEQSYESLQQWFDKCPENVPICLLGNKIDCRNRVISSKNVVFHKKHNMNYFEISCRSLKDFDIPILYLLKIISKK